MSKKNLLIRSLGFLIVGIFIALIFTLTPGTYSVFTRDYDGPSTNVEAATSRDFIKEMEIDYEGDQPFIRLEKSNTIDYSPVVFFSIEGELRDYILHINSVKLDDELSIPIIPNVNLPQAISLIISPNKEITGEIKIKHLNEFIDEKLQVKIPKKYLIERYFSHKGLEDFKSDDLSISEKDEMIRFVERIILYASPYMDWNSVAYEEDLYEMEEYQNSSLPISKMDISYDQESIMDLIAPNLLEYNEKLYSLLEILLGDLNNLMGENKKLTKENQRLMDYIIELEGNISQLNNQADEVEIANE